MIIFTMAQEAIAVDCSLSFPQIAIGTKLSVRSTSQGVPHAVTDATAISNTSYVWTLKNITPEGHDVLEYVFTTYSNEYVTILTPDGLFKGYINLDSLDIVTIYNDTVPRTQLVLGGPTEPMYERTRDLQEQLYDASFKFIALKRRPRGT